MKVFMCHKTVLAKPMTRGEYNKLRGWELPENENAGDEGYLVEYPNSPTTGMPEGFTNYISWSPKEVFEDGYLETVDDQKENGIIRYFAYKHLPAALQVISKPIGIVAKVMESVLPEGAEKSAGLRKLLEAKDCFVRAALDK